MKDTKGAKTAFGFSNGKDSIATWLQLRRHGFEVTPYYREVVPGLEFIERSLRRYEEFFGARILRYPDPSLLRQLEAGVMQTPASMERLARLRLRYDWTGDDIRADALRICGNPEACSAAGWRCADGFARKLAIERYGTWMPWTRRWYPVFDWPDARIEAELEEAGLELPVDYRIFPRSFQALNQTFLPGIKEHFPEDFERIKKWFPLVEVYLVRSQYQEAHEGRAGEAPQQPTPAPGD